MALIVAVFAMIGLVGAADLVSSPYLAFAIFYVVPVAALAWIAGRRLGVIAACASVLMGLIADLVTIDAWDGYAVWNLANRLFLFVGIALVVSRLRTALVSERELSELKSGQMRRVAEDSREPLADISAKVVNLGFDADRLSDGEIRSLFTDLVSASARLSSLLDTLSTDANRRA